MDHGPWTDRAQPNLVHRPWSMVYGLWSMVYGLWSMVCFDYEHDYEHDEGGIPLPRS
jgi:hypothetical protein